MTITLSSPKRNVESIRQKNLEDNQLFLEKLLMANIRNDFVNSARSILRKDGSDQIKKHFPRQYPRGEHATRYNEKVKSGEMAPHVPEWQRLIEEKKKEAEKRSLEKEQRRLIIEQKKQEYERKRQENEQKKLENQRKREEYQRRKQEFLLEKELRKIERELKREERIRIRLAKRRPRKPSKWVIFEKNHPCPYQRSFKPRHTQVGERAEQSLFNLNMSSQ